MTLGVRFDDEARLELRLAIEWYELHAPGFRARFVAAMDRVLERLRVVPGSASLVSGLRSQVQVRRTIVEGFPFWLVFLERPAEIYVVAVAHMRREPNFWTDRLDRDRRR